MTRLRQQSGEVTTLTVPMTSFNLRRPLRGRTQSRCVRRAAVARRTAPRLSAPDPSTLPSVTRPPAIRWVRVSVVAPVAVGNVHRFATNSTQFVPLSVPLESVTRHQAANADGVPYRVGEAAAGDRVRCTRRGR